MTSAPQIAITPQATITSQPAVTPRMTAAPQPTTAPTPPPGPEAGTRQARLFTNGRWQPEKVRVPRSGSGRYRVVPGQARPPRGKGKVVRYIVEVERGLPFDREEFALQVHRILNDPRGWGFRFHRVSRGPVDIRVSLSSPAMTDRRCLPLRTLGLLSCWNGGRAVINAMRWNEGAPGYRGDVASYREYVISHEVGHGLGHGHVSCPGRGRRAPVMLQQTKSLHGCRPNPWPFPERGPRALG
ncbi:lipoprotein [Planobispora rosea]|nr:lipoprotein [Planobispora rosea]